MARIRLAVAAAALSITGSALAEPRIDPAFAAHAVIQRDRPIAIAGAAAPGEAVTVTLNGATGHGRADRGGRFRIPLPPMAAGGPYVLTVSAPSGRMRAEDIMIGDVFLCSGQSNMEMTVGEAQDSRTQIAGSADPAIRMMTVPRQTALAPRDTFEITPQWEVAGPDTAAHFSAACFYMMRELRQSEGVPMGAIHSSWGGTRISGWMTDAGLVGTGSRARVDLRTLYARDQPAAQLISGRQWQDHWRGANGDTPWLPDAARDWRPVPRIGYWEEWGEPALERYNGMVWFRTEIMLTAAQAAAASATLDLGVIDDADQVWVNGRPVGNAGSPSARRRYMLQQGTLVAGRNIITINVHDFYAGGGMVGPAEAMALTLAGETRIPLGANWLYSIETRRPSGTPRPPWDETAGAGNLYAAMVAPLGRPALRGVAWYQGESDTAIPGYAGRLSALIDGWRTQFGDPALPFAVVQIASYGQPAAQPGASGWSYIRDEQRQVAAADRHVALTPTLDIGDPFDIHPGEKRELGRRLARTMRAIAYAGSDPASGPVVRSVARTANGVTVTFDGVTGDLLTRGGDHAIGFELCGATQESCRFVAGRVEGSRVILAPDGLPATRIRYAWADSPTLNLFDAAGLPAGTFELPLP